MLDATVQGNVTERICQSGMPAAYTTYKTYAWVVYMKYFLNRIP
jgi:hypothetical protein